MEVFNDKEQQRLEEVHYSIWLQERVVSATNKKGDYIFKKFDDFYKKNEPPKRVNPELYEVARRIKAYNEKGGIK